MSITPPIMGGTPPFVPTFAHNTSLMTLYPNPVPMTPFTPMRALQIHSEASYQHQKLLYLQGKSEKIYALIEKLNDPSIKDSHLSNLAKKLAPHDPVLALEYAFMIQHPLTCFHAMLEIAHFQKYTEARQTLQKIKESYILPDYEEKQLFQILEIENKRGFPEAQQTREALKKRGFTDPGNVVFVFGQAVKAADLESTLEKTFANLQSATIDPLSLSFRYQEILCVAAKYQLPLMTPVLEAFRKHARHLSESDKKFYGWRHMIEAIANHPNFYLFLDQEVNRAIQAAQVLLKNYPYEAEDCDYELNKIFNTLLSIKPSLAVSVLHIIPRGRHQLKARIKFCEYTPVAFNLQKIINDAMVERYSDSFLALFSAIKKHFGYPYALPCLDLAKNCAEDVWDYAEILRLEIDHNLPSSKVTLKYLYQCVENECFDDQEVIIEAIIYAELKLLLLPGERGFWRGNV